MSATILVAGYETAIRRRRVSDRPPLDRPWEVEDIVASASPSSTLSVWGSRSIDESALVGSNPRLKTSVDPPDSGGPQSPPQSTTTARAQEVT